MWRVIVSLLSLASFTVYSTSKDCMTPIASIPSWPQACREGNTQPIPDLPERVLNWGSQGREGIPWRFSEQSCNDFIVSIFNTIIEQKSAIKLSPHDLFHAHVLNYGAHLSHRALVFHAKEYPANLEVIKNYYQDGEHKFLSTDKSYQDRNFVVFSQDTEFAEKNIMYLVSDADSCHNWFEEANTLSEQRLAQSLPEGRVVGDLNVFQPHALKNIKYRFHPNEFHFSGKSEQERQTINAGIDSWLSRQANQTLVYFMTGRRH